MAWIRFIWLRIHATGRIWVKRQRILGFQKMHAVSLDAEELSAAQSGLSSMEWVSYVCFRSKMFKLFHTTRQHCPRLNHLHAKLSTGDKSGSEIRTPLIFHIRWRLVLNFTPKPRFVPPPPPKIALTSYKQEA